MSDSVTILIDGAKFVLQATRGDLSITCSPHEEMAHMSEPTAKLLASAILALAATAWPTES